MYIVAPTNSPHVNNPLLNTCDSAIASRKPTSLNPLSQRPLGGKHDKSERFAVRLCTGTSVVEALGTMYFGFRRRYLKPRLALNGAIRVDC